MEKKGPVTLNDVLRFLDRVGQRSIALIVTHFKDDGQEGASRAEIRSIIEDGVAKGLIAETIPDVSAEDKTRTYECSDAGRKVLEPVRDFEGVEPLPTLGQGIDALLPPVKEDNPPPSESVVKKKDDQKAREHHLKRVRKAEANIYFPLSWRHKPSGAKKDREDEVLLEEQTLDALKRTAREAETIVQQSMEVAQFLLDKQFQGHVLETAKLRAELVELQKKLAGAEAMIADYKSAVPPIIPVAVPPKFDWISLSLVSAAVIVFAVIGWQMLFQ